MTDTPKTDKQRSSVHVWCRQVAQVLNDAGLDMKKVLNDDIEIPWTEHSVKEHMYKVVLAAMSGKESTESMDTTEPGQVCNVIARHLSQNKGVTLPPFPSRHAEGRE